MPSFVFEVTRKRVWGAVKHGAKRVWHCGPVSFWWTAGRVSEEMAANEKMLLRACETLLRTVLAVTGAGTSD